MVGSGAGGGTAAGVLAKAGLKVSLSVTLWLWIAARLESGTRRVSDHVDEQKVHYQKACCKLCTKASPADVAEDLGMSHVVVVEKGTCTPDC